MTPDATRRRRLLMPMILAVATIVIVAAVAIVVSGGRDDRWVPVGTLGDVNAQEVVFVRRLQAYVVARPGNAPIALIAKSPHSGEPVVYCESSAWFEDPVHGSKFDHLGRYAIGPAPRGLDRLPTMIRDALVYVDPTTTLIAPAPRAGTIPPEGPFCAGSH